MRRFLITALLALLSISPALRAQNVSPIRASSAQIKISSANKAKSGFYLEIKRSYVRAHSSWQKRTITLLKFKGFAAFTGEPKSQISDNNIKALEKTSSPRSAISSVYVGPYQSEAIAERMIPDLLAALKPLIDDEKKNDELDNRYLFLVGVVRVL